MMQSPKQQRTKPDVCKVPPPVSDFFAAGSASQSVTHHRKPAGKNKDHVVNVSHISQNNGEHGGNGCEQQRPYHRTGKAFPRMLLPEQILPHHRGNSHNNGNRHAPVVVKLNFGRGGIPTNNRPIMGELVPIIITKPKNERAAWSR
jgi:hypothetical protein